MLTLTLQQSTFRGLLEGLSEGILEGLSEGILEGLSEGLSEYFFINKFKAPNIFKVKTEVSYS